MGEQVTLAGLTNALLSEEGERRRIVAIAGAPGSGKSTTADQLRERLNARRSGVADVFPMDGFHYDDMVLNARGHRPRKGAPHTFDLDGYRTALERLRADDGREVAVPVFDRSIEIARAGGRIIEPSTRIVLTEGNYLLLDELGWRDLGALFDVTVMVEASEEVLIGRLTERWMGFQLDPDAMVRQMEGNDLPNMRLVLAKSRPADLVLRSDA
ncbi:nucleoside triphosphate hydrolase [Aureimonas phyllosphaerae]|uniref:Pantothenate kinase n=1 Tax=Aureimonas phyllosphaerae TaxID=1166078 RepID=A0A7W6BWK9_9HYPH|nr:nucleoside triphosphate hydrolase [Aureimonas phyllosphaerae]MBB3936478.1 pantothenate kinase [Aureimonas phyllosphaerae]MBB3960658.1 pantothenate kinase [Aureimonas phyllosphaerae]SFF29697.1 AAA domain-containing protein [Aureimonas phyllosphaerae]